jgi:hypothetical protein
VDKQEELYYSDEEFKTMHQDLQKNIVRVLSLFGLIIVALVVLTIVNVKTGYIDSLAQKLF